MKTPEQFLREVIKYFPDDYVIDTPDEGISIHSIIAAMEEYKNQFIDFDGPMAMVDYYSKQARIWELAHNKQRQNFIKFLKYLESYPVQYTPGLRAEIENMINHYSK